MVQTRRNPSHRDILTVLLALAGIGVMVFYAACDTSCSYLEGDVFGIDLKYVGIGFMSVLIVLVLIRQPWMVRILLAGALGGEIHLVAFQIREDVFCPFCLAFAAILLAANIVQYEFPTGSSRRAFPNLLYLPGEIVMPIWKNVRLPLLAFLLAGYLIMIVAFSGSVTPAYGADGAWVPSYGKGNVEITVFTDYFCPPCQAVEKDLEPVLEKVLAKGQATVTFVDMPIHRQTVLYAKYFLYAVRAGSGYQEALQARRQLFDLAKGSAPGSDEALSGALQARHVRLEPLDVKPTFQAWDAIIQKYRITSTPTLMVKYSGTDVRTYRGSTEIRQGLEALRKVLTPPKESRKRNRGRA